MDIVVDDLSFRLLGPLSGSRAGVPLVLGRPKARALLAVLALQAGDVVSTGLIVEALWDGCPPASAGHAIQVYVGSLRSVLEPTRRAGDPPALLLTERSGYRLAVERDGVDAHRFEALLASGRADAAAGRDCEASDALRGALALWRGRALANLADRHPAVLGPAARRLEELYRAAVEERVDADLALGRHVTLVAELGALVAEQPTRERRREQLMVALYRSGQQAAALEAFREARERLNREGLDPGPRLRALEVAILRQDPTLNPPTSMRPTVRTPAATPDPTPTDDPAEGATLAPAVTAVHLAIASGRLAGCDPDLATALSEIPERLGAALREFGGEIIQENPGAVVAVFGHRRPHEDDPERAVRAALRALGDQGRYCARIAEAWDADVPAIRGGIATARDAGPDGARDAHAPTRAAADLAGAASPGAVLVDGSTQQRVDAQFHWSGDDPREVTGAVAPSGKIRGLPGVAVGIIGREDELAAGRSVLDAAQRDHGGILWITGEVGLGKSRVIAELRRHAATRPRPPSWLAGTCLSYGEGLTHWPIRELVHTWLGTSVDDPEVRLRARLRARLGTLEDASADTLLGLTILLGLEPEGAAAERARMLPSEALERLTGAAVRDLVVGEAQLRPVVLVVDDAHWADAGSLGMLEELLGVVDEHPVTLLLAHRPERGHPSWRLRERTQREFAHRTTAIVLAPLSAGHDADLLAALTTTSGQRRDQILATAEGNPFFLEELVRFLPPEDGRAEIPATVEQVLSARIRGVSPRAQQLLTTAAVIGRRFGVNVLEAVGESTGDPRPALRELTARGLIVPAPGGPGAEFEFRHALTHEAAYRLLWPPRRRGLHRRAAEVLAARAPDGDTRTGVRDAALARHWERAGDDAQATTSYRRAGRAAFAVHALEVAHRHFSAGLAAARRLEYPPEPGVLDDLLLGLGQIGRLSGSGNPEAHLAAALDGAVARGDLAVEWQARSELGFWLAYHRGRHSEARASFEAAARAAARLGDVTGHVGSLARVALLQAGELELVAALEHAEEAIHVAGRSGDEHALARALDARKLTALFLGELDILDDLWPRSAAVLRRHDDLWTLQFVLAEAGLGAAAAGRWVDARTRLDEADEINQRCGDQLCRPYIGTARTAVARTSGEYGEALRLGAEAVAEAVRGGWWESWARTELGVTLLELRDPAAAVDMLRAAVEVAVLPAERVRGVALLARACNEAVLPDEDLLDTADALLDAIVAPPGRVFLFGADAALGAGTVHLAHGNLSRAEALARSIIEPSRASGWREPLAQALLLASRCARARGDGEHAAWFAGQALEVGAEAGLPAITWQARALLAGLVSSRDATGGLRRAARQDIEALAATLSEPARRAVFVDAALTELDGLAQACT